MSSAVQSRLATSMPGSSALIFLVGSLLVHGVGFYGASRIRPNQDIPRPKAFELVEIAVPPPVIPPPEPEKPPPPAPKVKPPPIKVASVSKPLPPPKEQLPPPPNETPPEPPKEPPPLVVGVTMSSTTVAGAFAAPVGNTAYGKVSEHVVDPAKVKAYLAAKYAPIYQVDQPPELLSEFKPAYPEEARRSGIEGRVTLQIAIDATGKVTSAKVIDGAGYGLNEAAREGMLKAKFRPALKNGEAVATSLTFVYRFELP